MIDLSWVADYIDIENEDIYELAEKIKTAGINIEQVITNNIDNLVIGEVIECVNHPDSDHLHVCKVNVGNEVLQIVCGAPNVREGLKVIVAKVGAKLPGDFEIKQSKIRGVESCGMLCALYELGLEEKTEEAYNRGIEELDSNAVVGEDPIKFLGLGCNKYELDIHKHRNNDCYYHIGFAYEIAAILNKKVTLPDDSYNTISDSIKDKFNLEIKTDKCPFYIAKMVTDVELGESPEFIKRRLINAGMRPINNVVDISNYVMLEYGQPMHFFDKDTLGNKILVRDALENEEVVTLDGNNRVLTKNDIVITDGEKPVCIAGVMGGLNTEVTENTKTILIESAIFDAVSIRNTASRLNLKSEASIRYGKGLNYEYTIKAMNRACHLLEKYANAKVLSDEVVYDTVDKSEKIVTFKAEEINKMLGIKIDEEDIKHELDRLMFEYEYNNSIFTVTIPKRRLDIDPNVNDIAEEIGRLYGYQNLVSTLPKTPIRRGVYVGDVALRKNVSKRLRSLGLNEVKTYTLTNPKLAEMIKYDDRENISLPNPLSIDKSVVRTTLIPSLLNIYTYNKSRKVKDVFIYEIAKTYDVNYTEDTKISVLMKGNYIENKWQGKNIEVDFYLIKGIVENLLEYLGFRNRYSFVAESIKGMHPYMAAKILLDREEIGIIGKIHPKTNKDNIYVFELSLTKLMKNVKPLKYKAANIYPEIEKDVAFIVNKDVTSDVLVNEIRRSGGRLLESIDIFDIYTGENVGEDEKSIAFNLKFTDSTRTLTDEEVMQAFNNIIDKVTTKCGARLRDK